jgi:ribose transport system permease protein
MKLQAPVWYMILIVLLFAVLVNRTVFFRRYYFIGGNEKAARLSGIRVEKMKIWAFVISAGLAGIAGILLSSRLGAAFGYFGTWTGVKGNHCRYIRRCKFIGWIWKDLGSFSRGIFYGAYQQHAYY